LRGKTTTNNTTTKNIYKHTEEGKKNTYQLNMNVDIQLFSTQTTCLMCEKEGVEQQKEGWG